MNEDMKKLDEETQEVLKKIGEYKKMIDDAENVLDATIMDLEDLIEEGYGIVEA